MVLGLYLSFRFVSIPSGDIMMRILFKRKNKRKEK